METLTALNWFLAGTALGLSSYVIGLVHGAKNERRAQDQRNQAAIAAQSEFFRRHCSGWTLDEMANETEKPD